MFPSSKTTIFCFHQTLDNQYKRRASHQAVILFKQNSWFFSSLSLPSFFILFRFQCQSCAIKRFLMKPHWEGHESIFMKARYQWSVLLPLISAFLLSSLITIECLINLLKDSLSGKICEDRKLVLIVTLKSKILKNSGQTFNPLITNYYPNLSWI